MSKPSLADLLAADTRRLELEARYLARVPVDLRGDPTPDGEVPKAVLAELHLTRAAQLVAESAESPDVPVELALEGITIAIDIFEFAGALLALHTGLSPVGQGGLTASA